MLKNEYQLFKDQWGLNLKYSHEAGEATNLNLAHIQKYAAAAFFSILSSCIKNVQGPLVGMGGGRGLEEGASP